MTDWLPWGAVMMAGTMATLALTLRALGRTPVGERPDLRQARMALWLFLAVAAVVYSLYLVTGEGWVWYLH